MKKNICVVTATRAEYGLLSTLIKKMRKEEVFNVNVAVTGAHLSPEFGLTYKEIEADGIRIDKKIENLMSADTSTAVSKSMGLALISFSEYFEELKPDAIMILGDRYEMLATACAAMNARIPLIHLHGGETTEGAVDEAIRHALTKMSYLHFTSTEIYRKRVIQLGETPNRVFCVGALGVENALKVPVIGKNELEKHLEFSLSLPYAVVTFHPVTLEQGIEEQMKELLRALDQFDNLKYIFTKANADTDGRIINKMMSDFVSSHENAALYDSLGMKIYLNTIRYCTMVIGNSSSGLIEVPSFHIPTINIGDRQKGRIKADSVIDCLPNTNSIQSAMKAALDSSFQQQLKSMNNPYGDGSTSDKVIQILREKMANNKVNLKKTFYDIY